MTVQELLVASTQEAMAALFRSAKSMPADKLEWIPMGEARSALDQLKECAMAPLIYLKVIEQRGQKQLEGLDEIRALKNSWHTLDEIVAAAQKNTAAFSSALLTLCDEELMSEAQMPWGESGIVLAAASMPSWNFTYHLGSINTIQRMYGDIDMH